MGYEYVIQQSAYASSTESNTAQAELKRAASFYYGVPYHRRFRPADCFSFYESGNLFPTGSINFINKLIA